MKMNERQALIQWYENGIEEVSLTFATHGSSPAQERVMFYLEYQRKRLRRFAHSENEK